MRPKISSSVTAEQSGGPDATTFTKSTRAGGPCLETTKYGTVQNRGKYRVSAYGSSVDVDGPKTPYT